MKVNIVRKKNLAILAAAFALIFAFSHSASATPHPLPPAPLPPVINHAVPDGGSTLPLLGLALIGIEVLRRKRKAP